jgi:AcrR family transcriptional regulator
MRRNGTDADNAPAGIGADRSNSRVKLMRAAVELFAERGIKAVSIRDIGATAGVNSALIAYYFGGKEELVVAVYRAVAEPINAERHRRFDAFAQLRRSPTIEEILDAWISPVFIDYVDAENAHFVQLALGIALYDPTESGRLAAETFEEINERFISLLEQSLPNVSRKTLVWRLYFLIGTLITAVRQRTRGMRSLSRGQCNPQSIEELHRELIDFAAAGFRALSGNSARPDAPTYAAGA